ncbi:hypothetical protein [uncultured Brachyspira sp.]|nr:hypothetical protein [uncultured Brachyspira sp.]
MSLINSGKSCITNMKVKNKMPAKKGPIVSFIIYLVIFFIAYI